MLFLILPSPTQTRNSGRVKQWIAGCGWVPRRGGLVAAAGMRLYPLGGQPLGFSYLFASHQRFNFGFVILCILISLGRRTPGKPGEKLRSSPRSLGN